MLTLSVDISEQKALQRELSAVEAGIDDDIRGSPAWREKEDLLASVPGVGPTIARTLIAEMPELGSLDRVRAWVRVFGMVNSAAGFNRQPAVINGFSDLILELWGAEAGAHARSADDLPESQVDLVESLTVHRARLDQVHGGIGCTARERTSK